ncbi:MAG: tetratricopeptide repeat protein [Alphaproteobacteria bacterium]|nr:MAG: tetratricopeptide repeat protein [Alphaproteobacteria bacterium]
MADIFNEVDEEVRKDKSLALWNAYGKYLIALVVLIVAGTAAWAGWQKYQASRSVTDSAAFEKATRLVDDKKYADAAADFSALAKDGSKGYAALAALREAAALQEEGKGDEALKVYDALAADSSAPEEFSSLADLLAGYYLINNGSTDEVRKRVGKIAEPGGVWSAAASELVALSYLKDGDRKKAKQLLTELHEDAGIPAGIKERVGQLLDTLKDV